MSKPVATFDSIIAGVQVLRTEHENQAKKLARYEEQITMYSTLKEIHEYMGNIMELDNILDMVHDVLTGVMGVSACATLIDVAAKQEIKQNCVDTKCSNIFSIDFFELAGAVMGATKNKMLISNLEKQPIEAMNHGTLLVSNIHRGEERFGIIAVYYANPNMITPIREEFFTLIAGQLGIYFQNAKLFHKMKESAITDSLTQIRNRGYLNNLIANGHFDTKERVGVIMIDIDNFKKVNDTYGHQTGDEVLKSTAKTAEGIAKMLGGRCFRYGGEEIICTFSNKSDIEIVEAAKSILSQMRSKMFSIEGKKRFSITASLGVSFADSSLGMHTIINQADEALYHAKRNGKNKVVSFVDPIFNNMKMSEQ